MAGADGWPAGWQVWTESDRRIVLVYRPDVFDGSAFPAVCLPTIYVTHGRRERRPGVDPHVRPGDRWHVRLFLEPDVERDAEIMEDRESALVTARDLAERFASGTLDYRGLYQLPREAYLDRLDELTGPE